MRNTAGLRPPWKPGESGNKNGRPRSVMKAERLRQEESAKLIEFLHANAQKTLAELKAMIDNPAATIYERMNGQLLVQAAQGNKDAWSILIDRMVGKNKEVVETQTNADYDEDFDSAPRKELMTILRKASGNE